MLPFTNGRTHRISSLCSCTAIQGIEIFILTRYLIGNHSFIHLYSKHGAQPAQPTGTHALRECVSDFSPSSNDIICSITQTHFASFRPGSSGESKRTHNVYMCVCASVANASSLPFSLAIGGDCNMLIHGHRMCYLVARFSGMHTMHNFH